ncbi:hypothetical protein Airi01_047080 [Actinoallomurus iriomotensis]|uniref:Uncharacterized protein n=1 Tax=Actinoallomurus iriomotensis TaxID=478107 RepID=A0A9W6RI24_9ACTN|nr:hypothetical protein Airi01_047080 [Actinoallomurus iriomotensis]
MWSALAVTATAVCLWAAFLAYSPAMVMAVTTGAALAVYPAVLARSRLSLTAADLQARWPHSTAGPPIPWAEMTGVELRRGLLLEKVQVITDRPRVLFAPARFRYRADPVFDAAVAELSRRSGRPVGAARPRLGAVAAGGAVWVACLVLLTAMEAPWNDPSWPWRHEAGRLPGLCSMFASTARVLLPPGDRTPDADLLLLGSVARQEGCTWRSGVVGTFSVGLGLTHKGPFRSAGATAHDGFRRTVAGARRPDRHATPVSGLADEAREIIDGTGGIGLTTVDLIARRANVIVTVRLISTAPAPDAARAVERAARTALANVRFG